MFTKKVAARPLTVLFLESEYYPWKRDPARNRLGDSSSPQRKKNPGIELHESLLFLSRFMIFITLVCSKIVSGYYRSSRLNQSATRVTDASLLKKHLGRIRYSTPRLLFWQEKRQVRGFFVVIQIRKGRRRSFG